MNKKKITVLIILIILIFVGIIYFAFIKNSRTENELIVKETLGNASSDIIYKDIDIESEYLYDFNDTKVIADKADLIIIGKVNSIEYTMIDKNIGKYRDRPLTYCNVDVNKILKGNEKAINLEILQVGGQVSGEEFLKGNPQFYNKEGFDEKEFKKSNVIVRDFQKGNLKIEKDKYYVLCLFYDENTKSYMVSNGLSVMEYDNNTNKVINAVVEGVKEIPEEFLIK